jgi:hypothetical protein
VQQPTARGAAAQACNVPVSSEGKRRREEEKRGEEQEKGKRRA